MRQDVWQIHIVLQSESLTARLGELGWVNRQSMTGTKDTTVIEVTLKAGHGHNCHRHPNQEEVIYVMSGEIEQWLAQEKQVLKAGDSVFLGTNVVHASFNIGQGPTKLLVTLGPCVGEDGYEFVDVSSEAPWNTLRSI